MSPSSTSEWLSHLGGEQRYPSGQASDCTVHSETWSSSCASTVLDTFFGGGGSLVVTVTDSWQACHEFEP
ncbi:hypothetical protein TNCV_4277501 [Trichonephila clavipes]|nr:hypothetical protein TNCV_4277501 [Trichonephila clavipes]